MCGILFSDNPSVQKDEFLKALGLMHHRGPDAPSCYFESKAFKLGHNRLKILDIADRSNQPFFSADKRFAIVYNGEIYNYRELAQAHDIAMRTECDTELLLGLYIKIGPRLLNMLNGMFTFVIVDFQTQDVFIARDRLGIKPLYIAREGDQTSLSSEIAPLVDLAKAKSFDNTALRQYRKLRAPFGTRTAYSNIEMFPPAHYMFNGHLTRYWKLPEGPQAPPTDEEVRDLIESAVRYRCLSDVPVGSYLSGGLDSTIVAGLASKPDTWTVGFRDRNEFEWGRMAAENFRSDHSEVLIDEEEFIALATEMIVKRKEPLSVPNEVLLYKMTGEVKKRNTVVLSGEGADELFFGYDRIFRWAASADHWDIREFARLYSYGSHDDIEIVEDVMAPYSRLPRRIDRVAAFFQTDHLHGLLRRLDNSTMLCSVEARVPFVDHRLVERMAGVPFDYRMKGGVVKAPLKRVFDDLVPKPIIERVKVGFPVPLDSMHFGPAIGGNTAMDRWLEFNLNVLSNGSWNLEDAK